MSDIELRTRSALRQFDQNMAGIFDRAAFYEGDLYSTKDSNPNLSRLQACFKWTLLSVNVLFLIFAIVLISVGSYALNHTVAGLSGVTLPAGIIAMGVFIMLIALLGGCSAYKESRVFLGVYFVFLLIFTIILFAVGIAVYIERNSARKYLTDAYVAAPPDFRLNIQQAFQCCGLNLATDPYAVAPCPTQANISNIGCLDIIVTDFQNALYTAGACGIAFAVIMVLGLIFICYLMNGIKRKKFEIDRATLRQSNNTGAGEDVDNGPSININESSIIDATDATRQVEA